MAPAELQPPITVADAAAGDEEAAGVGVDLLTGGAGEQPPRTAHEVPRTNQARNAVRICL